MANLRLVCDNCDSTAFNIQRDTQHNAYECICADCGKHIATIGGYSVNWVTEEEENTDGSNPTT